MRLDTKSSSTRTFVIIPAVVLAECALAHRRVRRRWAPLMVWGYLQYLLSGRYRTHRGGGGPGMSKPPTRLVTTGIYGATRNPMYLGHLLFLSGLLAATRSPVALGALVQGAARFHLRIQRDEKRLEELFGDEYHTYAANVPRYVSPASFTRVAHGCDCGECREV